MFPSAQQQIFFRNKYLSLFVGSHFNIFPNVKESTILGNTSVNCQSERLNWANDNRFSNISCKLQKHVH